MVKVKDLKKKGNILSEKKINRQKMSDESFNSILEKLVVSNEVEKSKEQKIQ
jgi:hypothetical protein